MIYRLDFPIDSIRLIFLYALRMILFSTAITISYCQSGMILLAKLLTTYKESDMDTITKQDIAANAMAEATAWLDQNGVGYRFIPPHQIKVSQINFWPGRGTITIDGDDQKRPEKGLDGFILVLGSLGLVGGGYDVIFPEEDEKKFNPFRQLEKVKFIPS